jgi:hypothetical protein
MRRLLITCLLGALSLGALVPATASAVTVGISDQQSATFDNPLFKPLKLKVARYIAPYDVLDDPAQKAKLDDWIAGARRAKVKILLSVERSRREGRHNHAPSTSEYKRQLQRIKKAYGKYIESFSAWNEVNVCQAKGRTEGQPSKICRNATGPKLVASYYKIARSVFKGKKIVGLDILDGVNVGGAVSYLRKFKRYAKPLPKYWGIHNYSDTNRGSTSRTQRLIKEIGSKSAKVWLTETGGQLKLRGRWYGEARAAKALRCMFYMPKKFKQIDRLYIYNFWGTDDQYDFDAGLVSVDGTTKRAGYAVVQKRQSKRCGS